ncbi:MAG: hypothetical protein EZS28_042752, partial [Streblomastix strix]
MKDNGIKVDKEERKLTQFSGFVNTFMNRRVQAIDQDNKGLQQFSKIVMNASYGSD